MRGASVAKVCVVIMRFFWPWFSRRGATVAGERGYFVFAVQRRERKGLKPSTASKPCPTGGQTRGNVCMHKYFLFAQGRRRAWLGTRVRGIVVPHGLPPA